MINFDEQMKLLHGIRNFETYRMSLPAEEHSRLMCKGGDKANSMKNADAAWGILADKLTRLLDAHKETRKALTPQQWSGESANETRKKFEKYENSLQQQIYDIYHTSNIIDRMCKEYTIRENAMIPPERFDDNRLEVKDLAASDHGTGKNAAKISKLDCEYSEYENINYQNIRFYYLDTKNAIEALPKFSTMNNEPRYTPMKSARKTHSVGDQ